VFPWLLAVSILAIPAGAWQRVRLQALSIIEPALASEHRGEAHAGCERSAALLAELARTEAQRAHAVRELGRAVALHEVVGGLAPSNLLPVAIRGGAGASQLAAHAGPLRAHRVRLDQGRAKGVLPGQPLLVGAALVGRVMLSEGSVSEAMLCTAPSFRVRAIAPPLVAPAPGSPAAPPIRGIVAGTGGALLRFDPDGPAPSLTPGQVVMVEQGSTFAPTDVCIGVVQRVTRNPRTQAVTAELTPAADPARLHGALVLRAPLDGGTLP
jgi:hypothetical protein